MIENDMSKGSVLGKLIKFSIPFLISNFIQSLYNVADMLIVGRFCGAESMSGVNIGGQVTFILTNTVIGLCVGGTVLIGQYLGAGNRAALKKATATLITLLVVLSLGITVIMMFLRVPILHLIRTPPESFVESDRYLTVTLAGIIFIFGYNAFAAILRGMGNSKQPLYFVSAACVTNIVLDLVFVAVFNWAAFGAALATVISQALSVFLCINYMVRNNFQFDFKLRSFRIDGEQLRLIFKIGLPACIQNSIASLSFMFITTIVNIVGGVSASAGVGAVGKFNSFAFMPIQAMSASISAMSAQNFGAGRIDRAVSSCRIGTFFSVCVGYAFFALVMIFPAQILMLFGNDPGMIHDGVTYLRSFAFDFLLIPFIFCINGFLIGGGHTFFTLVNGVLASVLLRIPVCYFFGITLDWGLRGVGLGAPAASAGVLLVIIVYLFTGKWKHNVIRHDRINLMVGELMVTEVFESPPERISWWKDRIAYQIYPRSFQDSNGDGVGDIPGIISRLDEVKELGAGIIWLSPVYKSPDADNGYDISDYYSIDPKFGTMADMERLFAEAGKRDIKIIMDLVINHTSDEHEWFQKSRDPGSPYRDYYIWRPAKKAPNGKRQGRRSPPNNWTGFFMGEVWEYDEKSGEYYLHLFDKKQPDLNYKNPKVIEEIKNILRFWLDKGAAGFRCDVINILYKTSLEDGRKSMAVRGIEHYKSQEGNHAILKELRRDVLDNYDCFTVGETVMVDLEEAKQLCGENRKELDMLFYFEHLEIDRLLVRFIPKKFRASKLLAVLAKWQRGLEWNAVYLENHDQSRIVSHFGDGNCSPDGEPARYWERSAKMLALLELTLRGTLFIYQGQEIGMTNFNFKGLNEVNDVESHGLDKLMRKMRIPGFLRWKWIKASSRDNARTPMQWDDTKNAGFSKAKPWLGVNGNYRYINYASQKKAPASVLNFYKTLIALRQKSECLKSGEFVPVYADDSFMVYQRKLGDEVYTIALNFSSKKIILPKKAVPFLRGSLVIANTDRMEVDGDLLPWEGLLVKGS